MLISICRNYTSTFFVGVKHNYTGNETVQTAEGSL